ncbi:MAG TPA: tRNA dihydrouridine synthase DusB [bacterium]|nr:tRNA dihydrouridine synthase DusB [bacterium]
MSVLPREDKGAIDQAPGTPPPQALDGAPMAAFGKAAREFKLGDLILNGRVFLAPMAGYTDTAFRRLARRYGAAMVVTEMVSSRALIAGSDKTNDLMEFTEPERPVGVQLFGGDPGIMGEAAARVAEEVKPDLIDINFGCPVGKILKCDAGAAVLKEPQRAGWIVEAMVKATDGKVPITVKTRAGFDTMDNSVFELLQSVEEAGASALAIHARTRNQMFEGKADWEIIARLKQKAHIPIIGNGDVKSAADAYRLFQQTHCDGIMIGRGSMGAPWIFEEINHYLETGKPLQGFSLKFRLGVALEQLKCSIEVKGPRMGLMEMKKHLTHYLKGFEGAKDLRQKLLTSDDADWVVKTLGEIIGTLPEMDPIPVQAS